ncbi:MAG: sugar ABC transporter ATP-binding protein [Syntrophaceae bacterium]|nr:sugar ABC transporter ATP-binding protein [Syntrophaceae bacterium]
MPEGKEGIDTGGGAPPLLRMVNITKRFPGVLALQGVHLEVYPGEVVAVVGENGAGKTTLLEILNPHPAPTGFFTQDEGEIFFQGKPVRPRDPAESQRLGIAIIHQTPNLIPTMTVAENIFLGREPRTRTGLLDDPRMKREARALLKSLRSSLSPDAPVGELGSAQQQMVELAKALSLNAKLIVMDELTSALSHHEVEHIFEIIRSLKARGLGLVFVSHRLEEVFAIADRLVVLRDGKRVGEGRVGQINLDQVIQWMVGRPIEKMSHEARPRRDPALEVRNLSGAGIRGASFVLHQGEILAVTGLVGAGRTRLADLLFGVQKAEEGDIRVHGSAVTIRTPGDAIAAHMGYVPEDRHARGLVLSMNITENITLPQLPRFRKWTGLDRRGEDALAQTFMAKMKIATPDLDQKVMALSGGNQQKVLLSRWLSLKPKVLILDEPTKGVDVGTKAEIHRLLRGLADEGMGILMISSELPEVFQLSDRILVMAEGRIVADMPVQEATPEGVMTYATAGPGG